MNRSSAPALPIKRDIGLAEVSSLFIAIAPAVVSVAGLIWSPTAGIRSDRRSSRPPWEATLPISSSDSRHCSARCGSRGEDRCGALFNVLYAYALGAVLMWRRATLGYVAATGLLLVSGLNGLAFAASAVLDGLLAGRSIESAVVAVHLVISGVSFALLAFLDRDAAGRKPVGQPGISSAQEEAAR